MLSTMTAVLLVMPCLRGEDAAKAQQGNLNSGTTLHLGAFPSGVYLLTLIEANGMKTTQRISKQ